MIYYVDQKAGRDGDGSKERPFLHINDAAACAQAGDEILVSPGIYREYVNPRRGGREDARIIYRSQELHGAVITGAEILSSWKHCEGDVWTASVDNSIFGTYNPYTTFVCGDWYFAPKVRHTGSVFLNDKMMYEAVTLEECLEGAPDPSAWTQADSVYKWYSEQKEGRTVFFANFKGLDPREQKVEITVRRNCFMPSETGRDYITVSGFDINKAATTWAPPAAYQDGMIGPHWSRGWIIEDCEVWGSRCCGISLGKYRDPENDMYFYTRHVKSPTQMERDAVCRGQYHGWLKEKVGSHIIRRCHVHHCEQTGIVGRMGGVFSVIEDCHIHDICTSMQLGGAETAGIKLHAAIDVTIRRNHIHNCIMGIWCDWEAQGTRITGNLLHDNEVPEGILPPKDGMYSTDIFVEVGHGPTLIDHNLMLSRVAVSMPSEGLAIVHNLILGSICRINAGVDRIVNGIREPRYTPYHIRHRTEVAGFMTILHGDDRIYNNIFVQRAEIAHPDRTPMDTDYEVVGTAPFDIFPVYEDWIKNFVLDQEPDMHALACFHFSHLPVWVDGNVYVSGASVCKHEKHYLKVEGPVQVSLTEKDGVYTLKTDVYRYLGDFAVSMMGSFNLGEAFEPEMRFENPDGTDILMNYDYFGLPRGSEVLPGPFAAAGEEYEVMSHV